MTVGHELSWPSGPNCNVLTSHLGRRSRPPDRSLLRLLASRLLQGRDCPLECHQCVQPSVRLLPCSILSIATDNYSQMEPHRRKLPIPLQRGLVLDVHLERWLSVHPTWCAAAACGPEPDGEQCEAALEPDLLGCHEGREFEGLRERSNLQVSRLFEVYTDSVEVALHGPLNRCVVLSSVLVVETSRAVHWPTLVAHISPLHTCACGKSVLQVLVDRVHTSHSDQSTSILPGS